MAHIIKKKQGNNSYLYIQEINVIGYLGNAHYYEKEVIDRLRAKLRFMKDTKSLRDMIDKFKAKNKKQRGDKK